MCAILDPQFVDYLRKHGVSVVSEGTVRVPVAMSAGKRRSPTATLWDCIGCGGQLYIVQNTILVAGDDENSDRRENFGHHVLVYFPDVILTWEHGKRGTLGVSFFLWDDGCPLCTPDTLQGICWGDLPDASFRVDREFNSRADLREYLARERGIPILQENFRPFG